MKKIFLIFALLWGGLTASSVKGQTFDINKMFPNVVMSKDIYDKAKDELVKPESGFNTLYDNEIKKKADEALKRDIVTAVSTNKNPNNVDIAKEMNYIYQLCVAYLFSENDKYLNKAVEYFKAWASVNVAVKRSNIHETKYSPAVEGYSLIRKVISEGDRTAIDEWVNKRLQVFKNDNDLRINNWGTALLQQFYLYGTVLNDTDALDYFNSNYPEWVKKNLFPNGTTTDLLGRDAFAYHSYDLLFFAQICHIKAIREGYEAADAFYSKDVNWGASIKKSVDFWKPFLLNPEKYTHIEFLHTEYAPDENRGDYNKPYNPAGTIYVVDELYEMDKDLKRVIEKYREGNEFATWRLGLSALRWK